MPQNVNQYDTINVSKHSKVYLMGAFFVFFLKSLPQSSPYFYLVVLETLKQIFQQPLESH
ncbi:hypothetical protein B7727_03230 [Streptococcus oralis subsp. tigurinus]|uniref:Uncharacterized protein n=1 Tax=Streptococcus oralis subsp. tigurinus TaxID=1077464 RepID=A0A1X1GBK9_STROR|nr:hypothetical protein B7727_03230 [Streptococcus oralis subsp. tigurinus]